MITFWNKKSNWFDSNKGNWQLKPLKLQTSFLRLLLLFMQVWDNSRLPVFQTGLRGGSTHHLLIPTNVGRL